MKEQAFRINRNYQNKVFPSFTLHSAETPERSWNEIDDLAGKLKWNIIYTINGSR